VKTRSNQSRSSDFVKTRPFSSYAIGLILVITLLLLVSGVAIWRDGLTSRPPSLAVQDEGVPKEIGASPCVIQRSPEQDGGVVKEFGASPSVAQRNQQELASPTASGNQTALEKLDEEWAKRGFVVDRESTISAHLDALKRIFQDYYRALGEFPTGDSAAILKSLAGDNGKGIAFVGKEGELLDPWKMPYQFSRNGDEPWVEIRSAGPDRVLWSDDDFVAKVEVPTR
jgi:hypothetical protein